MLTSSRFRRQVKYFLVKRCWKSMKNWCKSNRNEVHPLDGATVESAMELE
jgi:hypothetical protein